MRNAVARWNGIPTNVGTLSLNEVASGERIRIEKGSYVFFQANWIAETGHDADTGPAVGNGCNYLGNGSRPPYAWNPVVRFRDSAWTVRAVLKRDVVLTHEIGHALGLSHRAGQGFMHRSIGHVASTGRAHYELLSFDLLLAIFARSGKHSNPICFVRLDTALKRFAILSAVLVAGTLTLTQTRISIAKDVRHTKATAKRVYRGYYKPPAKDARIRYDVAVLPPATAEELTAFADQVVYGTAIGRCTEAEYASDTDGYPLEILFMRVAEQLRGSETIKPGSTIGIVQFDTDKVADTDIKTGNRVLVYLVKPTFKPSFSPAEVPILAQVGGSGVFDWNGADLVSARFKSATVDSAGLRLAEGVSIADLSKVKAATNPNSPWLIQRNALLLERADAAGSQRFSTGPAKKECRAPSA